MKTDALVLGGELDGLVAALRLLEKGRSVRLLAMGGGALHYAPDGLHLLGYLPTNAAGAVEAPFAAMAQLAECHPLRLIGTAQVRSALDGFVAWARELGLGFRSTGANVEAVASAGQSVPCYALGPHQAAASDLRNGPVAVVSFDGHRDAPAGLLLAGLRRRQIDASPLRLAAPCGNPESPRLARFFDALPDPAAYFAAIKPRLPAGCGCALFPAVLGLDRHDEVAGAAERALAVPCREFPTLPPSIPGLRLSRALTARLRRAGALIHDGARPRGASVAQGRCRLLYDAADRGFAADTYIAATGGLLMGGLAVEPDGRVRESVFGLDVIQTAPLAAERPDRTLAALHEAGVATDERLRPLASGRPAVDNLFVTGRTLAHWNPSAESSAEGVAIATGWAAAEAASSYLEG